MPLYMGYRIFERLILNWIRFLKITWQRCIWKYDIQNVRTTDYMTFSVLFSLFLFKYLFIILQRFFEMLQIFWFVSEIENLESSSRKHWGVSIDVWLQMALSSLWKKENSFSDIYGSYISCMIELVIYYLDEC